MQSREVLWLSCDFEGARAEIVTMLRSLNRTSLDQGAEPVLENGPRCPLLNLRRCPPSTTPSLSPSVSVLR